MILQKIEVKNYKSITNIEIPVKKVGGSLTFCLLGINESGKSNILKGISLIDNIDLNFPLDFHDINKPINVNFHYYDKKDIVGAFLRSASIRQSYSASEEFLKQIKVKSAIFSRVIENSTSLSVTDSVSISFTKPIIKGFQISGNKIIESAEDEINLIDLCQQYHNDLIKFLKHKVVFWKSESKYLISDEIDLNRFSTAPETQSIPLMNCFKLIGIDKIAIPHEVRQLNNPVSISNMEQMLSDCITKHITTIWNGHPIIVKFNINGGKITMLVEDLGVKYNSKVIGQRSDGFKQLISFLLSISIENSTEVLERTILLLDEPETHLHPTAQLNLKEELLKIGRGKGVGNIVFYATHSNYLIDKSNLNRSFKVTKPDNKATTIEQLSKTQTSYSEINYEVFDIPTNDYHNELYGYIEEIDRQKLDSLPKNTIWIDSRNNRNINVSLSTYIRHSIHHPENKLNRKFTDAQLRKSIQALRKLQDEL